MVRPQEPDKIPINSPTDLHVEVEALVQVFQLSETEDTWEKINRAVKRFQATVRGGACRFTDDFLHAMRDPRVVKGIVRSLVTERTALSGTTLELVASCTRLGHHFAALLAPYLPTLLRLFARPNKVYVTRAASTIASIIRNTRLGDVVRFIVLEWRNEAGKSASFREQAAAAVAIVLGADSDTLGVDKESLERRVEDLEWLIKTGATGREASVRSDMKKCWEVYKREWPERVPSFTAPMTPTIRKYLKVTDAHPGATSNAASRPPPRKPAALSASTGPSSHAVSRPAPVLARSHGPPPPPPAAHAPSRAALSHSTAPSRTQAPADALSLGLGAPPPSHRAARVEPSRTASGSSSSGPSRSASRTDERDPLGASTSSTARAAAVAPARAGFKPTAPGAAAAGSKTGPLGTAARPAARALATSSSSLSAVNAAAAEPRKARRVAPPPVAPAPEPAPAPASAPLARSHAALSRSQGPSGAPPVPGAAHAPFRPKLNASVTSASSAPTGASKPKPPAARAPLVPAPAPPPAVPRAPRAAAAATAGTASSRAAAAAHARSAPSAATLASRERRAAREAAREREAAEKEREGRKRAEEASRREVDVREREERERERERAREVPLPPAGRDEDEDVQSEQGDSEMVLESIGGSQVTVVADARDEQIAATVEEPAAAGEELAAAVEQPQVASAKPTATAVAEARTPIEVSQPAEVVQSAAVPEEAAPVEVAPSAEEEVALPIEENVDAEADEAVASPLVEDVVEVQQEVIVPVKAEQEDEVQQEAAAPVEPENELEQEDEPLDQVAEHEKVVEHEQVVEPEQRVELEPEHAVEADEPQDELVTEAEHEDDARPAAEDEPVTASPVRVAAPAWDDFPPSPLLVKVQDAPVEDVEAPAEEEPVETEEDVVAARTSSRSPSPELTVDPEPVTAPAAPLAAAPSTPLFASYTPPASSPLPITRPSPPFTPATATPGRPAIRFPASYLQYSPEPFQTASIVLDTPPRLDELPGAVRLPGRVALPLAAAAPAPVAAAEPSDEERVQSADEEEEEEEEDEDEVLPASPLARKTASPPVTRPQAIFLDDYHPSSPYDDAETTFEADESLDAGADSGDEGEASLAETELAATVEQSVAETETEVVSAEPSREYAVPLNDTSAYDHLARPEEEAAAAEEEEEYDDSSAGEEDVGSAETTRMARSPALAEEQPTPLAREDSPDAAAAGSPISPAGSATQEFSFFGAPVSSTPSGRARHQAYWDASLLDDESACFELEQPQLRFHDETESEHEASRASTVLADFEVDVEPRRVATPPAEVEQPTILKRSLRNRTVTVELQTPAASKPLTRSTRSAARGVLGELQH
ncbi:hypothetical protein JCM10450v2_005264 [Rhodotorula kratochvilovae]